VQARGAHQLTEHLQSAVQEVHQCKLEVRTGGTSPMGSVSSSAGGEQQSVATPQAASAWARPSRRQPCHHGLRLLHTTVRV
jgi:hypothetical protein